MPISELTKQQDKIRCIRLARQFISPGDTVAEIGVLHGDHAAAVLNCNPGAVHLIDTWELNPARHPRMFGRTGDEVYNSVRNRFADQDQVDIHRCSSRDASKKFRDSSLDWVYVDADHNWHSVRMDIRVWSRKVRVGGFLCGHDYLYPGGDCTYPVHNAVDTFWQGQADQWQPVAFSNDWVLRRTR